MKLLAITILAAAAAMPAGGDPEGFLLWKGAGLKDAGKRLSPKMNAGKLAAENFATFPTHQFMILHREANGEAELHEKQADIFVAEAGEATLIVGGKMNSPRNTGPGEYRGPSITGGVERKVATGDVVHIPANIPHQLMVARTFTYFVVKVNK